MMDRLDKRWAKWLAPLLVVALVEPAQAQYEGLAPTRKQQQDLEPMVLSVALRLELHIPSVSAKAIQRRVAKVLHNQNSNVAAKRYKALLIDLLAEDLDLTRDEKKRVEYELLDDFGQSFREVDEKLLGADERWKTRDKSAYFIKGVTADHRASVRHKKDTIWKLTGWNGRELTSDQVRGIKDLAATYAPLIQGAFGLEKKSRDFQKLLEGALSGRDTDRAVLCTLCKMRTLVRPIVYAVNEVETMTEKLDAIQLVDERIEKELEDAEWWPRLRKDHKAMIEDPRAHRRVLKARKKG